MKEILKETNKQKELYIDMHCPGQLLELLSPVTPLFIASSYNLSYTVTQ